VNTSGGSEVAKCSSYACSEADEHAATPLTRVVDSVVLGLYAFRVHRKCAVSMRYDGGQIRGM
jgi:hypothetical protein